MTRPLDFMTRDEPDQQVSLRELHDDLLDYSPDLLWAVGPDGKVLYANRRAGDVLGVEYSELIDVDIYDLLPDAFHHAYEEAIELSLEGRDVGPLELNLRDADGQLHTLDTRIGVKKDDQGQVCWFRLSMRARHERQPEILRKAGEGPSHPEKLRDEVAAAIPPGEERLARVLYIEDDADYYHQVREALSGVATTEQAKTLAEARRLLKDNGHYDLVLLDLTLPDGLGAELLPFLNRPRANSIPVVLMTLNDSEGTLAAHVAGTMVKTETSPEKLREQLSSFLDRD